MTTPAEVQELRWKHSLPTKRNWQWFDQTLDRIISRSVLESNPDINGEIATLGKHVLQHETHDLQGCWIRSVGSLNATLPELEPALYKCVKRPLTDLLGWTLDWARSPADAAQEFLPLARTGTLSRAAILRYYFKRLPAVVITRTEHHIVDMVVAQRLQLVESGTSKYARRPDLVFDRYRFTGVRLINVLNKHELDINTFSWSDYEKVIDDLYNVNGLAAARQNT